MQSSLPKIIAVAAACAACAAGGYEYGHQNPATDKGAAAEKPRLGSSKKFSAILVSGSSGEAVNWQALLKSSDKMDPDLLMAWARNLSHEEALGILQSLKSETATSRRNDLMGALYDAWAEQDPKGFLTSSGDVGVPRLREGGIDAALKSWAEQDPKAALQWIKDYPGTASTSANQQRFAAAIAGFAASDPQGALATVSSMSNDNLRDSQLKSAATKSLADALSAQGEYTEAATFFNQLPAGQTRDDAYTQLAKNWAESAPQDAAAWVATLTDPTQRNAVGLQVAKAWAENDPADAAAWAAKTDLAQPDNGGQLLATAVRSWTSYDLDTAGQFLNQLPESPAKDPSVAIFALRASQEDPQSALQWVNTISDENMRNGVTIGVSLQWMQQDPAGFNQFLATTTALTDQQKQLLTNIPPQALQGITQFNTMLGGGDAVQNLMENSIISGRGFGGRNFGGGNGNGGGVQFSRGGEGAAPNPTTGN